MSMGGREKKNRGRKHTQTAAPCADVAANIEWSSSHAESHLRLTAWGLVASRRGAAFVIAEVRHFR